MCSSHLMQAAKAVYVPLFVATLSEAVGRMLPRLWVQECCVTEGASHQLLGTCSDKSKTQPWATNCREPLSCAYVHQLWERPQRLSPQACSSSLLDTPHGSCCYQSCLLLRTLALCCACVWGWSMRSQDPSAILWWAPDLTTSLSVHPPCRVPVK